MTLPHPETPTPLCIRLPFLRGPLPPELDPAPMPEAPAPLRLWPGHRPPGGEVPEGWHRASGYPFSPAEADSLLAAFRALDARDLAGERDAADRARERRRARELGELADLAAFAGRPPSHAGQGGKPEGARESRVALEQAQKLLLWIWLQEERLAELAELAAGCARGLTLLAGGFAEEAPGDVGEGKRGAVIPLHPGLVPPWRVALAGAALFVDAAAAFFVEGPMREELLDLLEFSPAPEWGLALGCAPGDAARVVAAEAPVWRALGRPRPEGPGGARVWLTWGRA